MSQYIDKSALVSEIEKLEKEASERLTRPVERSMRRVTKDKTCVGLCRKILDIIDTLEVKEVDLDEYYHEFLEKEWFGNSHVRTVSEMMAFTAKHFFELGISVSNKAKKREEV